MMYSADFKSRDEMVKDIQTKNVQLVEVLMVKMPSKDGLGIETLTIEEAHKRIFGAMSH